MEAPYFKMLRSAKKRSGKKWVDFANWINKEYGNKGVNVTAEQVKEWAKRGMLPWGTFLMEAASQYWNLPPLDAGDCLSGKGEEDDDE